MTGQVIASPPKPVDQASLAIVGASLRDAIPLPDRDAELQLLIQVADKLVQNMRDYVRPDCSNFMFAAFTDA